MKERAKILAMLFAALVMVSTATGEIIFVDADATGGNDGSSWVDAFNDLQDALTVAQSGDEVRVAEGVYTPMGPLLPMLPGQAGNPIPSDGEIDCSIYTTLSWSAGTSATSHDVYLGTNSLPPFVHNQILTEFYAGNLDSNTTYYWRIDGVNWWGTTVGVVWSFTTVETPPSPPPPWLPPLLQATWNNSQVSEASLADREATFQLINGVTIKGGYAGFGEPDPNVRDIQEYETFLSGDLDGNDVIVANLENLLNEPTRRENSYHVVTGSGTDATAILDGFTITGGNAPSVPNRNGGGMLNDQGSPTVLNCTFRENAAYFYGGGMCNLQGSPTLTNCIFSSNLARYYGGGMHIDSGNPTLSFCTFSGNMATQGNGGGIYIYIPAINKRDPKLTNCIFSNNSAKYGGAIFCRAPSYPVGVSGPMPESSPLLTNCIISGNSANIGGGIYNKGASAMLTNCTFTSNSADSGSGIYNDWGKPTVTNCTFSGNLADSGSGIYNGWGWPIVTNCTFTGNSADYGSGIYDYSGRSTLANCILWDGGNEIWSRSGSTIITYSDVQSGWPGEGNIVADPLFVDPAAGNYHLSTGSPCIDAGDPNFVPYFGEMDVDGEPRVMGGRIDMGIDEFTSTLTPILRIWPTKFQFHLYADIHNSNSQILTIRNTGSGTMHWRISENCPWLEVYPKHGTSIGEINEVKVTVDITRLQPGAYNYEFRIMADGAVNSPWMVPVSLFVYESGKLHVPSEHTTIQEAIDYAFDGAIIIVAIGTYTGDGNRDIDFHGKAITVRSVYPNDPNTVAATIIDCNGTEEDTHRGFYFHSGEEADSVLSGLTIRNGYAPYYGGGIYCVSSHPTITNCTFRDNTAQYWYGGQFSTLTPHENRSSMVNDDGEVHINNLPPLPGWRGKGGGIYCFESNATLTNCKFIKNSAHEYGGGMYNNRSSPTLANCTFIRNTANDKGGGMCNNESSLTLTNCTFSGNSTNKGWPPPPGLPLTILSDRPMFTDYALSNNIASAGLSGGGGGIYSSESSLVTTGCTFNRNSANSNGGGMMNFHSSPMVVNCTFAANAAINGNALGFDSYPNQDPINIQITNCILWDGGGEIWNNDESTIAITYSDVESGWPGEGNINADPCFVEPGYWDDANGVWVDGDYHLLPDSPCIDAGDPNYVPEPNETDLDGRPRVIGSRIDMGAYEYSYSPLMQAEVRIVPRTINLKSKGIWIAAFLWLPGDYNVADIDPNSVFLEFLNKEIKAEPFSVNEQQQVAIANFDRSELRTILNAGDIELTITGRLADGTVFEATDAIRVVDKGRQKADK
ncbi:MAG: hypothetical protein FVQ85_12420 [Planctomycetes bacterium]|nr:hypothetical protein [Planctomycetota bacterium]